MSDGFTDICLSDTNTASSLCSVKGVSNSSGESTRDSVLPEDLGNHLFHARQLKRFGEVRIAGGAEKFLGVVVDDVAGQKDDAPGQFGLRPDRLLIEFAPVHSGHAKIRDDHVELLPGDPFERVRGEVAKRRDVAQQGEHFAKQFPNRPVVVENEDPGGRRRRLGLAQNRRLPREDIRVNGLAVLGLFAVE